MEETKSCPLCNANCKIYGIRPLNLLETIDCQICGKYNLTSQAKYALSKRKNNLHIISGITRNFYELHKNTNGFFVIEEKMIDDDEKFQAEFVSKMPKTILEKAALLLQYIARNSDYPGKTVLINLSKDYPVCFCKNSNELYFFIKHLEKVDYIVDVSTSSGGYERSLTAKGWQEIDSLNKPNIDSKQAFVAMWFGQEMDESFEKGILPLADAKETGFKMFRVDKTQFNDEKICDKIVAEIKKSRFLIADVTKHRQAVYFEAGYAMGMGIPVIWTCKEDEINNCCFDTRQYPHILWKDADDLRIKLKDKILAAIGKAQ